MFRKIIKVVFLFLIIDSAIAESQQGYSTSINTASETSTSSGLKYFTEPFLDTFDSLTNAEDSWGMQNRAGHWHLGLMFGGTMGGSNMKMRGATGNVMIMPGYNFNKYLGIQYNQMISYSGTFTGIGEATIMIPTGSMVMPYAAAGAGWSNMSGAVQGAWDVGGGINIALSKTLSAVAAYRYIQTMAASPIAGAGMNQPNARAAMSMVSGGLVWYF